VTISGSLTLQLVRDEQGLASYCSEVVRDARKSDEFARILWLVTKLGKDFALRPFQEVRVPRLFALHCRCTSVMNGAAARLTS